MNEPEGAIDGNAGDAPMTSIDIAFVYDLEVLSVTVTLSGGLADARTAA
jgi:hypothetical protein